MQKNRTRKKTAKQNGMNFAKWLSQVVNNIGTEYQKSILILIFFIIFSFSDFFFFGFIEFSFYPRKSFTHWLHCFILAVFNLYSLLLSGFTLCQLVVNYLNNNYFYSLFHLHSLFFFSILPNLFVHVSHRGICWNSVYFFSLFVHHQKLLYKFIFTPRKKRSFCPYLCVNNIFNTCTLKEQKKKKMHSKLFCFQLWNIPLL